MRISDRRLRERPYRFVLDFLIYGGTTGIMAHTGLAGLIAKMLFTASTSHTLAFWAFISSCIISLFWTVRRLRSGSWRGRLLFRQQLVWARTRPWQPLLPLWVCKQPA